MTSGLQTAITLIGEATVLISAIIPALLFAGKIAKGTKCQLRSEMLRIYYHNKDLCRIRQYEFENFVFLYEAYKALHGNSFIDTIYGEVRKWQIVS